MTKLVVLLLALLFSMNSTAIKANADIWHSTLAAKAAGNATGVLGRSGEPLVNAAIQPLRNQATTISGRQFTGHALDQMQNRIRGSFLCL